MLTFMSLPWCISHVRRGPLGFFWADVHVEQEECTFLTGESKWGTTPKCSVGVRSHLAAKTNGGEENLSAYPPTEFKGRDKN